MSALTPRPGIMKIAPYVPGKDSIDGKETIAKLSSNEGALGPSPKAMEAYAKAASELHRYPDGDTSKLRKAIGRHYGLDPARIVCGAGSDEILNLLVRAYCGPGDELLYSQYGFLMYAINALGVGATPVAAPAKDYGSDIDALLAAVTERTRIVCLANPNNPTGTYVTKDDVRRLHAGLPKNVLLIIDAAYAEYVSKNDYESGVELVDQAENVVMTRTFSKIYGLGGLRLGWMYGPAGIVDVMSRLRQPFNVNLAAQIAGIAALEDIAHTDASRTNNDIWLPWLSDELKKLGLAPLPSVGNFVLVGFGSKERAMAANDWLMNDGLIPRLVAGYGLPEHLRITVGTETEVKAVQASLARFVAAKK
ncbi:histidinol-phosphate transaminase [Reyranella aquatilis]|jgi:histidinol-phosphate aminotransferase|uniref:Histidinol-phosphate aminotransferase n=1 Tax=Reyranella aquatilis TaxID=2035356 RepID=A0ABS8KUP0_9HYPH|nr:histidinol-phosphate transaminase [Reyranella aquatilis]MCC8429805.1 histidinol-phosphate transaminase [Reyranella aquatilis]